MRAYPRTASLSSIGPALLYVNVEWCPHCRAAKPTLEAVSQVLGTIVPVYSVDGDARPDVAKQLGVEGFPTIVYVTEDGRRFVYEGDRTVDAITSFVCHNSADRHQFCRRIR